MVSPSRLARRDWLPCQARTTRCSPGRVSATRSWTCWRGDRTVEPSRGVRAEDEENRVSSAKKQEPGKESKAEFCYDLLRSRILEGTYVPGYRLVINQLAQETGVSTI